MLPHYFKQQTARFADVARSRTTSIVWPRTSASCHEINAYIIGTSGLTSLEKNIRQKLFTYLRNVLFCLKETYTFSNKSDLILNTVW